MLKIQFNNAHNLILLAQNHIWLEKIMLGNIAFFFADHLKRFELSA